MNEKSVVLPKDSLGRRHGSDRGGEGRGWGRLRYVWNLLDAKGMTDPVETITQFVLNACCIRTSLKEEGKEIQ